MKKIGKRTLALLVAVCLILAMPLGASADTVFFEDVKTPDQAQAPWYSEAVYGLLDKGILSAAVHFRPDRAVTREEFITMLGRVAEGAGKDLQGPWLELAGISDYARPYFSWAASNGIIRGDRNGLSPKRTMTRQEMAVILLRFANYMGIPTPGVEDQRDFNQLCDRDEISPWAKEDVQVAYLTGLVNGIREFFCTKDPETGVFASGYLHYMKPKMAVTRAQAAQVVYNYVKAADLDLEFFGGLSPL